MITFFDKKTQHFLTVFTKYPSRLIEKIKYFEDSIHDIFLDSNIPHLEGYYPSVLKFLYTFYFQETKDICCHSYFFSSICGNLELGISYDTFNELHGLLCKYGSIDNVGRYLYGQKDEDTEKDILNEYDVTFNFDPMETLKASNPHRVKLIRHLMSEDPMKLQNFEEALHTFAEELSKFKEITDNKELLFAIDNIFSKVEQIYADTFNDIYSNEVMLHTFCYLTFGVTLPDVFGNEMSKSTYHLINKMCAKILTHPMLYHYYFQDIIRDQGVHNDFFYSNARKEAEEEHEDLVKNLSKA